MENMEKGLERMEKLIETKTKEINRIACEKERVRTNGFNRDEYEKLCVDEAYVNGELSALFDIWNYMLEEKKKELMESMEETKNAQE